MGVVQKLCGREQKEGGGESGEGEEGGKKRDLVGRMKWLASPWVPPNPVPMSQLGNSSSDLVECDSFVWITAQE